MFHYTVINVLELVGGKTSVVVGLEAQLLSAQGNALGNHAHLHSAPCKGS